MVVDTYMIPMRDGVRLATTVLKPEKEGRFPTVLIRHPYFSPFKEEVTAENFWKLHEMLTPMLSREINDFLENGYCVIVQHCRGTGNSEGQHIHSKYECNDGTDTMDWIRHQDFYNKEIFRIGGSYLGLTTLIDAKNHQDDVKGLIAIEPVMWFDLSQVNGVFNTGWRGAWTPMMELRAGRTNVNTDVNLFRTFPQKDWGKLMLGHDDYIHDINNAHPFHDDPFWRSPEAPGYEIYESLETLRTPLLLISGWMDLLLQPNLFAWNHMIPKETREKSAMVILPYGHPSFVPQEGWAGFEMDGSEQYSFSEHYAVNWFNHLRNGEPLVHIRKGEVAMFPEAGQNRWFYEKEYFHEAEERLTLYLNSDRALGANAKGEKEITYLYNPYNPAIFYSGCERTMGVARSKHEPWNPIMQEQDAPNSRPDIISFTGKKFDKHCFIKGNIRVNLTVKSDCEDTSFYVRICIVKDGIAYGVRDDIRTLCHELGDYIPGEKVVLNFEMTSLLWEIFPGDELRVDVSSSCFPTFAPHTNVKAKIQAEVEKPVYAHNTIVCGESLLTIPVCDNMDNFDSIYVYKKNHPKSES